MKMGKISYFRKLIIMKKAKIIYCMDGYHNVEIPIKSLDELLFAFERIKFEALVERKAKVIFSADVVIEGVGRYL